MTVTLPNREIGIARKRFEEHWSFPMGCDSWHRFIGPLFDSYDYQLKSYVCIMGDDQARVIRMLNGPHYKTILKMMAVQ